MIHGIVQFQEIDSNHIDPLVLNHLQNLDDQLTIFRLDIVIVIENSLPIDFYDVQATLILITNGETLVVLTFVLSEIFAIVPSLDSTLEIDSTFEINMLRIHLHQDHLVVLRLHLEDLSIIYNQVPQKVITTTQEDFQSQKTNLKLTCIPLS